MMIRDSAQEQLDDAPEVMNIVERASESGRRLDRNRRNADILVIQASRPAPAIVRFR